MKTALLILLVFGIPFCAAAQNFVFPEYRPATYYFDSLIRNNKNLYPKKSLYNIVNTSYIQLTERPNSIIAKIDTIAENARMTTDEIMSGIVASGYLWHFLYDSVYADTSVQAVLPAIDLYNNYLCHCAQINYSQWPPVKSAAFLGLNLDSCKRGFRLSKEWSTYKRVVDSMGVAFFRNLDKNTLTAYFIKTCNNFRQLVKQDLPRMSGRSPAEQLLMATNKFHNAMILAVLDNAATARKYASKKTADTLFGFITKIQQLGLNDPRTTRMTFYNNRGNFYFLRPDNHGALKIVSLLSYDFKFTGKTFQIENVTYKLRKNIEAKWLDDTRVYNHYFRYPMIPVTAEGFPLNNEIPKEEKIPSKYEGVLSQFNLTPPAE